MAPRKGRANPSDARARQRHIIAMARSVLSASRRSYIPKPKHWPTVCGKGLSWLLPWELDEYPGIEGACRELLAGRVSIHAMKLWRAGKGPMPDWFASILAGQIQARLASGAAILAELQAYRAPVSRKQGAMIVQADGRDRRGGRIGRTGGHPGTNQAGETRGNSPPKSSLVEPDLPCPKSTTPDDMSQ